LKDREDEFTAKMSEIEKLIMLKKRFVMQCERLGDKNPLTLNA
jgi:hypothetical protein